MSVKKRRKFVIVGAFLLGVLCAGGAGLIFASIIAAIAGFVGGWFGGLFAAYLISPDRKRHEQQAVMVAEQKRVLSESDLEALFQQLVNWSIRVRFRALPPTIVGALDATVDVLRTQVVTAAEEEGTVHGPHISVLREIITERLPELLEPLCRLKEEASTEQQKKTVDALVAIQGRLLRIHDEIAAGHSARAGLSAELTEAQYGGA